MEGKKCAVSMSHLNESFYRSQSLSKAYIDQISIFIDFVKS
jgi:hypothetical protein